MVVSRRSFFRLGGAAAIGLTLDPERLLWVPGAKTYVFMPRPEWKWSGWHEYANADLIRGTWSAVVGDRIFVSPSFVSGKDVANAGARLLTVAKQNAYESAVYQLRHAEP